MFLDFLKKKFDKAITTVATPENIEMVKGTVTTALQSVKSGVSKAVDFAVDTINELGNPGTVKLDELHAQQREDFFNNLLETLVNIDPYFQVCYERFVNWLRTVPYQNVTHYLTLFQNGELSIDPETLQIDGPDFFVPNGETEIRYKPKNTDSNIIYICTTIETALKANYANIYIVRVSMPNTGTHDERFPVLYMVCPYTFKNPITATEHKKCLRREYIAFINERKEHYAQSMTDHRNDPRNQKHTDWKSNVQSSRRH